MCLGFTRRLSTPSFYKFEINDSFKFPGNDFLLCFLDFMPPQWLFEADSVLFLMNSNPIDICAHFVDVRACCWFSCNSSFHIGFFLFVLLGTVVMPDFANAQ